ncbi:hypothetical protein F5I97DRAFT_1828279 [Phlebopus sp. FC_14]|nr:hypothetical protein F5I97DRAFT_1828279 [Phlebopus sp. FC_14]
MLVFLPICKRLRGGRKAPALTCTVHLHSEQISGGGRNKRSKCSTPSRSGHERHCGATIRSFGAVKLLLKWTGMEEKGSLTLRATVVKQPKIACVEPNSKVLIWSVFSAIEMAWRDSIWRGGGRENSANARTAGVVRCVRAPLVDTLEPRGLGFDEDGWVSPRQKVFSVRRERGGNHGNSGGMQRKGHGHWKRSASVVAHARVLSGNTVPQDDVVLSLQPTLHPVASKRRLARDGALLKLALILGRPALGRQAIRLSTGKRF